MPLLSLETHAEMHPRDHRDHQLKEATAEELSSRRSAARSRAEAGSALRAPPAPGLLPGRGQTLPASDP